MNTGPNSLFKCSCVQPLLDEVFEVAWTLGQAEYQILSATLMQPYGSVVQRVAGAEIAIDHSLPEPRTRDAVVNG